MPGRESQGMRFLNKELLGLDELQWWQDEQSERLNARMVGLGHEAGWIGSFVGPVLDFGWEVYDAGSGLLSIRSEVDGIGSPFPLSRLRSSGFAFLGVGPGGEIIEVPTSGSVNGPDRAPLVVPNDGTWYTLVARRALSQYEPGTLEFVAGSTTVTGTGTNFTRYGDDSDVQATLLRIDPGDSSEGNEGTYQIDTITDSGELVLVTPAPSAETGLKFRVKGQFKTAAPTDPDIHNVSGIEFALVARTTTRRTDSLIVADVKRAAGNITILDRKRCNMYRQVSGDSRSFSIVPYFSTDNTDADKLGSYQRAIVVTKATASWAVKGMSVAPCWAGAELTTPKVAEDQPTGLLAAILYDDTANRKIIVRQRSITDVTDPWKDVDGGAEVLVVSVGGTTIVDVTLIALPPASGFTHLLGYVDGGNLKTFTSADQGATWVGPTTVWTPAAGILRLAGILTRMGRIVMVSTHPTGSEIRYIYSDDLGATWSASGAGVGSTISATTGAHFFLDIDIVEDDRGNLWTTLCTDYIASGSTMMLFRGASEGVPAPDAAEEAAAGWKVGLSKGGSGYAAESVTAFALPNGMVGAFQGLVDTGVETAVWFLALARKYQLANRNLVQNVDTGGAGIQVACSYDSAGYMHLLYNDLTATGVKVFDVPFVVTEINRPHTWGGL